MYRILSSLLAIVILSIVSWQAFREGNYLGGALAAAGIIGLTGLIFYFINTTNRKLTYFFSALENDDYTIRFVENEGMQSERLLNHILNRIKSIIQNTRIEIQQKERYYELILNSISSGVIALDDNGFVLQLNRFALKLIDLEVFTHVSQLRKVSPVLVEAFKEIRPGENRRVTYTNERGSIQLLITASGITVNGKHTRLLVINDIENEMDEKEIDSWIRLIRVLAHEIMNSIAPIVSLSGTLLSYYRSNDTTKSCDEINDATIRKTVRGLDTIKSQGQSLMNFTNSYRQLARLQAPNPNPFSLSRQVRNIELLFQSDLQRLQIGLTVYLCQDEITVNADEELLSQVLINLLKNAMEALEGQDNGEISLTVKQPGTTTLIEVTDNGPGIPHDMLEDIFIPFFTTKNKGTGIGLSLSRQIVRMHGGELQVSSQPYSETRFTLSLPNAGEFPPAK